MAASKGLWAVPAEWPGETVFIICGGPSVGYQPTNRLLGRKVIAVNSSYETVPFAQYVFFGDNRWFNEHRDRPEFKALKGRIVTCSNAAHDPTGRLLKTERYTPGVTGPLGLCEERDHIASQRTSAQGAMNLAYHLGAARIVLLGLDMGRATDGRTHHHKPHIWANKPGNLTWDIQMKQLRLIVEPLRAKGIQVFNTNANSRCKFWPFAPLESFL